MVYLAFGFYDPDDTTVEAFRSTAVELGYEVRRWPIWGRWGRRVILCAAVPSWGENNGLDLYDALRGLVEAGRIPRWVSLGCASEAEWEAGEPVPSESGGAELQGGDEVEVAYRGERFAAVYLDPYDDPDVPGAILVMPLEEVSGLRSDDNLVCAPPAGGDCWQGMFPVPA